jgi:hypothetical protein
LPILRRKLVTNVVAVADSTLLKDDLPRIHDNLSLDVKNALTQS